MATQSVVWISRTNWDNRHTIYHNIDLILSKPLNGICSTSSVSLHWFIDGVLLFQLRVLRIGSSHLHRDDCVRNTSILCENADIRHWFNVTGDHPAHSTIHHSTTRLSECTVSWWSATNSKFNFFWFSFRFNRWPAWGCRWLLRALGVSYELRGIENIKREHGGVVLMNHQSAIDLAGKYALHSIS